MTRAAPKFVPDQARALFDLLAPFGGIHLVAIHPKAPAIYGKHFERDVDAALEWTEKQNADGFGVYWSVNAVRPQRHKKPTKGDISHARFVHVDIDPPKTGGKFDKEAIVDALTGLAHPPSFVIDSGGGLNALWRLDEPCENLASIEAINQQVREYFDAAPGTWNIDRVLRVPGTVNYPNAIKRARGRGDTQAGWAVDDQGEVHDPAELSAAFPAATSSASSPAANIALSQNINPETPDSLGLAALDPVRLAISEPPGDDRSGDGVAAARLMANAGLTDEQIVGTLLNAENAVSAHYLDQRDPKRAAARTLQLVRADGPPSPPPGEKVMSPEQHRALVENMKAKARAQMAPQVPEGRPDAERKSVSNPQETAKNRGPDGAKEITPSEPQWLADLGNGGLARFVRHVIATAPSPQPWVTLGASIAMFGAIAGRRYAGPTNLRTNIYSIGICDSGGGKDHPLRAVTRLMIEAGLAGQVGGSKIASGSGLVTAVTRHPAILFPLDEVGFLISSAADRKRAPKHITEIIDNLTEFYSLADSTFLGTAYANDKEKPREVIEQPCLCLFGVTTPGVFWGSLSSGNVLDGSLARMLIFQSENDYPDAQHDLARRDIPQDLVDLVQAISEGAAGHNPFPIGEASQIVPKPYTVPYADDDAAELARAYRDRQISMLREHRGSNLTGIIARLAENAAKIALVKAITDNPDRPAISCRDLEWGMMVARQSVEALMQAVKERVADNEQEARLKRLHMIVKDAGAAGIDLSELTRRSQWLKARERTEILNDLEAGGQIRIDEMPKPEGERGRTRKIVYDVS
ncbi:MAG: hypothetical protein CMK96_03410 [Pseudomonas sp.]|nr:hypothetical protein [Pseudomonas sp.]